MSGYLVPIDMGLLGRNPSDLEVSLRPRKKMTYEASDNVKQHVSRDIEC